MRKLSLETLDVESFETAATDSEQFRGTVHAFEVSASPTSCCPKQTYVYACPVSTGCP
ncbi:MAG TPA: pinensin family lanthipeptide [Longimicrobiaceae bacterium]|nr:pinensin family lanthipeptide [Longimicrobiaceae bacterium]